MNINKVGVTPFTQVQKQQRISKKPVVNQAQTPAEMSFGRNSVNLTTVKNFIRKCLALPTKTETPMQRAIKAPGFNQINEALRKVNGK